MKLSRRCFLKTAGVIGIGAGRVRAQSEPNSRRHSARAARDDATISKIRVAQIKVYPDKAKMEANHKRLTNVLRHIEESGDVDVVVTPEGFLDGYVATEKSVTKEDMVRYAIDPLTSHYARAVSNWASQNKAWFV